MFQAQFYVRAEGVISLPNLSLFPMFWLQQPVTKMDDEAKHYSLDQLCDEKRILCDKLSETVSSCKQLYQGRALAFKIRQNAFPAGAPPRTPLGELTMLSQIPQWDKEGDTPLHTPSHSCLWCSPLGAFGASISGTLPPPNIIL